MRILFIGQVVPEERVSSCTGYSVAGDMMQKNIVRELQGKNNVEITIISALPNASFPTDKFWIQGEIDTYKGIFIKNISYINILGVKQIFQENMIYREAFRQATLKKFDVVICYNMYPQFGNAAIKLSKKLDIPLIAILADLPLESIKTYRGINKLLFIPLKRRTMKNISQLEHGVVLNENVKHYMKSDADYMVVPGGIDIDEKPSLTKNKIQKKKIVYAGALSQYSGIMNLIDAVNTLDIPDIYLEIYGSGQLKNEIEEIAKRNYKIRYMGTKNLDEMRKIMEKAWILVNPRVVDDPISAVTFPSKVFEYIMCRRPVITTEFKGMPEDIKKITIECGAGSPQEIKKAIGKVNALSEEEIDDLTQNAYDYVKNNISWEKQGERIYKYINQIIGEEDEKNR